MVWLAYMRFFLCDFGVLTYRAGQHEEAWLLELILVRIASSVTATSLSKVVTTFRTPLLPRGYA